ncbi:MAG: GYD domain-containing protein [Planctomycetales bacterium]|nr:GYD domain-containing protein [Planctomycetales bacterium]
MVRFLSLISFTDQGIRDVAKSIDRAEAFRADVESKGGKVLSQYWGIGSVDGCVTFECPDDVTAASLLLSLGKNDNVRTSSTRIFTAEEFAAAVKTT